MDDDRSPSVNRRLAAILAADVAGYSRLMEEDEPATVRDLKGHQAVVLPFIGRHGGRVIDTAGDGILAEFPSVVNAIECALEIQTVMAARNEGVPEPRRMRFRIAINLGDVLHDESRIYGDGINVARDTNRQRPWDGIISEEEQRAYRAAGFGRPGGIGSRPALLSIDVQYQTVGTTPMPFWEAIKEFPTSCGEVGWGAVRNLQLLLAEFHRLGWPVLYPHVAPKQATDGGRLAAKVPAIMTIAERG